MFGREGPMANLSFVCFHIVAALALGGLFFSKSWPFKVVLLTIFGVTVSFILQQYCYRHRATLPANEIVPIYETSLTTPFKAVNGLGPVKK
jgi:hypothetical protein